MATSKKSKSEQALAPAVSGRAKSEQATPLASKKPIKSTSPEALPKLKKSPGSAEPKASLHDKIAPSVASEPKELGWERSTQEEQMRDEVIELLKELGMYSKSFLYLIESCVQLVVARNMAFVQLRESGLVMSELSREGEPRLKAHPACNIYLEINKELRQVLEALKMTIRSSNHSEGDEMDKLNSLLIEKLSAIPQE